MLEFRSEKSKDDRTIVAGLFRDGERIGCAWETTAVGGLFNWSLHAGPRLSGFGYARDGYTLQSAMRDLTHAAHNAA